MASRKRKERSFDDSSHFPRPKKRRTSALRSRSSMAPQRRRVSFAPRAQVRSFVPGTAVDGTDAASPPPSTPPKPRPAKKPKKTVSDDPDPSFLLSPNPFLRRRTSPSTPLRPPGGPSSSTAEPSSSQTEEEHEEHEEEERTTTTTASTNISSSSEHPPLDDDDSDDDDVDDEEIELEIGDSGPAGSLTIGSPRDMRMTVIGTGVGGRGGISGGRMSSSDGGGGGRGGRGGLSLGRDSMRLTSIAPASVEIMSDSAVVSSAVDGRGEEEQQLDSDDSDDDDDQSSTSEEEGDDDDDGGGRPSIDLDADDDDSMRETFASSKISEVLGLGGMGLGGLDMGLLPGFGGLDGGGEQSGGTESDHDMRLTLPPFRTESLVTGTKKGVGEASSGSESEEEDSDDDDDDDDDEDSQEISQVLGSVGGVEEGEEEEEEEVEDTPTLSRAGRFSAYEEFEDEVSTVILPSRARSTVFGQTQTLSSAPTMTSSGLLLGKLSSTSAMSLTPVGTASFSTDMSPPAASSATANSRTRGRRPPLPPPPPPPRHSQIPSVLSSPSAAAAAATGPGGSSRESDMRMTNAADALARFRRSIGVDVLESTPSSSDDMRRISVLPSRQSVLLFAKSPQVKRALQSESPDAIRFVASLPGQRRTSSEEEDASISVREFYELAGVTFPPVDLGQQARSLNPHRITLAKDLPPDDRERWNSMSLRDRLQHVCLREVEREEYTRGARIHYKAESLARQQLQRLTEQFNATNPPALVTIQTLSENERRLFAKQMQVLQSQERTKVRNLLMQAKIEVLTRIETRKSEILRMLELDRSRMEREIEELGRSIVDQKRGLQEIQQRHLSKMEELDALIRQKRGDTDVADSERIQRKREMARKIEVAKKELSLMTSFAYFSPEFIERDHLVLHYRCVGVDVEIDMRPPPSPVSTGGVGAPPGMLLRILPGRVVSNDASPEFRQSLVKSCCFESLVEEGRRYSRNGMSEILGTLNRKVAVIKILCDLFDRVLFAKMGITGHVLPIRDGIVPVRFPFWRVRDGSVDSYFEVVLPVDTNYPRCRFENFEFRCHDGSVTREDVETVIKTSKSHSLHRLEQICGQLAALH